LLLALSMTVSDQLVLRDFLVLTIAINGVHFMASYRLLYSSRKFALSYPWASVVVPAALILWGVGGLVACTVNPAWTMPVDALIATAALYLALHYTGQVWGMVASYGYLEGIRFDSSERTLLRGCLKVLAVWHVVWALQLFPWAKERFAGELQAAAGIMNILLVASLVCGVVCFTRIGRRVGRPVPARVVLPFISLHAWYGFLYIYPKALFWVQLFHALQYIPFPLRVELNRLALGGESVRHGHHTSREMLLYLGALLFTSTIIFAGIPWATSGAGGGANSIWVVIACIINIHHYFIDGCIWRISNPVVSQELFAHTMDTKVSSKG